MPIPLGQAKITVTFDGPSGEVTIKATSQAVPTLDQLASSVGSAVERALADLVGTKALAAKVADLESRLAAASQVAVSTPTAPVMPVYEEQPAKRGRPRKVE